MAATEDLFTPIHKALRSMIYSLGGRLQSVDFADAAASTKVLEDLKHEFTNAVSSGCVLCLLHHHASGEEDHVFPAVKGVNEGMVRELLDEHHAITRRLVEITKMADELAGVRSAPQRVDAGIRLNQVTNEFFAYYLTHMNKEEVTIVPFMKEHFTDDQMRAMRAAVMQSMPKEQFTAYLRWMLPSLSLSELVGMLGGLKQGAPPPVFQLVAGLGADHVDPVRWAVVRERVGF
ncbi:MAG: hemerythrin domain-containing protein [Thermoplasmata archaeon]|nr:hemerythrin domain-containing protein [Thermoplasmata archaeon]